MPLAAVYTASKAAIEGFTGACWRSAQFANQASTARASRERASEPVHFACHGRFLERFLAPRRVIVGPMLRPMGAALKPGAGGGDRVGELLSAVAQPSCSISAGVGTCVSCHRRYESARFQTSCQGLILMSDHGRAPCATAGGYLGRRSDEIVQRRIDFVCQSLWRLGVAGDQVT